MNPNVAADFRSVATCENALVGSVLIDPSALDRVATIVNAADFLDPGLGPLFAVLTLLKEGGKPVHDCKWLQGELQRHSTVPTDISNEAALVRLVDSAVHAGHAIYYAEQVAMAANLRRLDMVAAELHHRAVSIDAEPTKVREWLEGQLAKLDRLRSHEMRTVEDVAGDALAAIDVEPGRGPGILTGISNLDAAHGPIMPGEVVVVAARTGMGKSSLATQIAEHNAERQRVALIVSLEMKATELVLRMLCGRAGIDGRQLRAGKVHGDAKAQLHNTRGEFKGLPLSLWSPPSATLAEIRGIARFAKASAGLSLLVVDYLGLVRPAADEKRLQRYEQVSAVSAGLKSLAKELDVAVLALAQLNREADNAEPRLSHLRESGAIEQDADAVWLLHHPPNPQATSGNVYAIGCNLIIAKHRHGETGRLQLLWHPKQTRFSSQTTF